MREISMHTLGRKEAAMNYGELEGLPDDILVAILSFLPWSEVLRLRTVCVKWNELLRSAAFRRRWRGRDPNEAPLCFIGCKEFGLSMYNPARNAWQVFGTNYPSSFFTFPNEAGDPYRTTDVRVVGAAHGLLLLQVFLRMSLKLPVKIELFVMNPLDPSTKKRIPLLPQLENHFGAKPLGICWNEITQSHQILLQYNPELLYPYSASDEESHCKMWTFYKYDLQLDQWDQVARWPADRVRDFQNPFIRGGRIYCLGKASLSVMPYKMRPYGLDNSDRNSLREKTWIEDENPSIPSEVQFAALAHSDQGSLLACGNVQAKYVDFNNKLSVLKKFSVWKLPTDKLAQRSPCNDSEWVEVYDMPEAIVQKINERNPPIRMQFRIQCATTDRFLCVANCVRDGAMFDITKNLWWTLPTHPLNYSTDLPDQREVLQWLGMNKMDLHLCEPRFDILV